MGIAPAPQITFLIYTNPIGNSYKVSDPQVSNSN